MHPEGMFGLLKDIVSVIFSTSAPHPIQGDPRMDQEIKRLEFERRYGPDRRPDDKRRR